MSTDEMIIEEMEEQNKNRIGTPLLVPAVPPAPPRKKRLSGIAQRLRENKAKAEKKLKALQFAQQILGYGTRTKAAIRSVVEQHGVSTREARAIVRDGKPRKHRRRSNKPV